MGQNGRNHCLHAPYGSRRAGVGVQNQRDGSYPQRNNMSICYCRNLDNIVLWQVLTLFLRGSQERMHVFYFLFIMLHNGIHFFFFLTKSLLRMQIFASNMRKVSSLSFWQLLWCLQYLFSDLVQGHGEFLPEQNLMPSECCKRS